MVLLNITRTATCMWRNHEGYLDTAL